MSNKITLHNPPLNDRLILSWEPHSIPSVEHLMENYSKEELLSIVRTVCDQARLRGYDPGITVNKGSKKLDLASYVFNQLLTPREPPPGFNRVNVLTLRPVPHTE